MDWAVLVKVVPPVEQLRFDSARKTMLRDGPDQMLNPFDRRALQLALDLRRPSESVCVLSMGPPATDGPLRDALALGADRVVRISDPSLAGSDSLVTARVLNRSLERVGHGVTSLGRWSVDAETGQLGPEVAGLLGVPVVSGVRRMERVSAEEFRITMTTAGGWRRVRCSPPIVVTVGEEAVRVRRPSPEEVEKARERTTETWSGADLGFLPAELGLQGSPTVVESLRNDEPTRRPVVFQEGPADARAQDAAQAVKGHLASTGPRVLSPIPSLVPPLHDDEEAFVLATGPDGHLAPRTLPFFGELRSKIEGTWTSAVWVGSRPAPTDVHQLEKAGAVRAYVFPWSSESVDSQSAALAIQELLDRKSRASAGVFLSDEFGREVAGQVAGRMGLGLVGDAVSVRGGREGLTWEKPSFGGSIIASIRSRTRPSLATVRPGSFDERELAGPRSAALDLEELPERIPTSPVATEDEASEVDPAWGDLDRARVVVTVGSGVGGPDGIRELLPFVHRLTGAIGATRRVADAGWLPRQLQVGLTGRSVAPELAILVGVSGATNHLVGLRRARVIAALNADAAAPVLRSVDVGLVGPWRETLPAFVEALVGSGPLAGRAA